MNQQDVFLVHLRELYARKIHKEPVWRESSYKQTPDFIPGTEPGSEMVSFVVDWQMECVEYEIIEKGYSQAAATDPLFNAAEGTKDMNSGEKVIYSNIFDW